MPHFVVEIGCVVQRLCNLRPGDVAEAARRRWIATFSAPSLRPS
jgi:hypothetical protein